MAAPLPSTQWTSFEEWDWGGMRERLESFFSILQKAAILEHVLVLTGKHVVISQPFSAGQSWCCLELVAEDGTFLIARVRLPRLPGATASLNEGLRMRCEVATMEYVRSKTSIPVPQVFASEMEGSDWACRVGAPYMIIEGFRGIRIQDVDIHEISHTSRQKLLDQWTFIQAELATITFPHIGALASDSELVEIATDEAGSIGPFSDAATYLRTLAKAKYETALNGERSNERFEILGPYIFCHVISSADIFQSLLPGPFPLSHMDIGPQNVLIDSDLNVVAVIDWEMAQTAPWEAIYFPMPFPHQVDSDECLREQLSDTTHVAHKAATKHLIAQGAYVTGFRKAEATLAERGTPLDQSLASLVSSDASKLLWMMEHFGQGFPDWDEIFMFATARIAFGMDEAAAEKYFQEMEEEHKAMSL